MSKAKVTTPLDQLIPTLTMLEDFNITILNLGVVPGTHDVELLVRHPKFTEEAPHLYTVAAVLAKFAVDAKAPPADITPQAKPTVFEAQYTNDPGVPTGQPVEADDDGVEVEQEDADLEDLPE